MKRSAKGRVPTLEGAVVSVEWLDALSHAKEGGLLYHTTTYGKIVSVEKECIVVATRLSAEEQEVTLIPFERLFKIELLRGARKEMALKEEGSDAKEEDYLFRKK